MAGEIQLSNENQKDIEIEIIGDGSIGAKAKELLEKTHLLRELGFSTPRRVVLASGFFNEFFLRNNLGIDFANVDITDSTTQRVIRGSFSKEQFELIKTISESFGDVPLVVRSSAEGDSRGTGTYNTVFVDNDLGEVNKAIRKVLSSYFTKSAKAFRKDANTPEGMGIIIEPLIGEKIEDSLVPEYEYITPAFSGYGYTSTAREGPYITIVRGLGGAVDSRDGIKITPLTLGINDVNFGYYLDQMWIDKEKRFSEDNGIHYGKIFEVNKAFRKGHLAKTQIDFLTATDNFDISHLFSSIIKIEEQLGKPQYFEFAITSEDGQPKCWITQIADIDIKVDTIDFSESKTPLINADSVTGTGIIESNCIVTCITLAQVKALEEYNKTHFGYILIYRDELISGEVRDLYYQHYSNSSVLLEVSTGIHANNPISHLSGQLDMTNKFFGIFSSDELFELENLLKPIVNKTNGIEEYNGKFKVISSERQNRLIVCKVD
ncbi:MAG: PEP/pyruvate-binding domain-containing protein [bacterium]